MSAEFFGGSVFGGGIKRGGSSRAELASAMMECVLEVLDLRFHIYQLIGGGPIHIGLNILDSMSIKNSSFQVSRGISFKDRV